MYLKISLLLLPLLFMGSKSEAQGGAQDSLRNILAKALEPESKIKALVDLGYSFDRVNEDSMQWYSKKAMEATCNKQVNVELQLEAKLLRVNYFLRQAEVDSALNLAQEGLEVARKEELFPLEGKFLNRIGSLYKSKGNYEQAMESLLAAADIFEREKMREDRANNFNSISLVYLYQNDQKNAQKYLKRYIRSWEEIAPEDPTPIALGFLNLAHASDGDTSSLRYAQKGMEIAEKSGKPGILVQAYMEMGYQNENQENYGQSLKYYQKSLKLSEEMNDQVSIADAHRFMGGVFILTEKYTEAIEHLNKALTFYKSNSSDVFTALAYEQLMDAYARSGAYEQAYETAKARSLLQDSLFNVEKLNLSSELEAKYENQKQAAELANQSLEIERQKNLRRRMLMGGLILGLAALLAVQWLMARRKRQQRQTELALATQRAEAEKLKELDQIKSTFFANISHEFRTPLTLIISPLKEMLQGTFNGNMEVYQKVMLRNAERLLQLINQLLDLSKLETKEMKLQARELDLSALVRQLAGGFESLAARKQIELTIKTAPSGMRVWLDKDKTEKIINNLLSNAFKFTPEEGKVEVVLKKEAGSALLTIRDSGIGIPADQLPQIFDRFFQVDHSVSRAYEGSGIGLALTKELVELHHGAIRVISEAEQGATFIVSWPLGQDHLKEEEKVRESVKESPAVIAASQPAIPDKAMNPKAAGKATQTTILLVEDNEDVRFYLREKLEKSYKVIEAVNGKAGLEKAIEEVPDLIVTDIMMPKMDGNTMSEQLRQRTETSHIPIVMLTARGDMDSKLEGLQTGADDYLTKPVDSRELFVRINNLIEQRHKLREKFAREIVFSGSPKEGEHLSQDERFMNEVMGILRQRMEDEEFGVEELAKALHLSRYQLLRKIKALTGKSVSVFIRWVRLNRARELLEQQQGTVSEVAFRMGFNSVAYFSSCFKEEFGLSPSKI